jgi:NADPH:quinone reductase-like Zn-dependent oxidoreductase
MTGGKGVDVVVNSLAGEALRKTWECIAEFGRFVEVGVGMSSLPNEIFHAP